MKDKKDKLNSKIFLSKTSKNNNLEINMILKNPRRTKSTNSKTTENCTLLNIPKVYSINTLFAKTFQKERNDQFSVIQKSIKEEVSNKSDNEGLRIFQKDFIKVVEDEFN
mmetsp:Transcript_21109/g.18717  ORF Transcript_21109/g.18717 Transcript_21109/m.18717 type:complete len:110 (+) Transcript_21109:74-403(+)